MNFPQKEDPMRILIDALVTGSSSDAIEMQEARGQSAFVRSEVLPKKVNFGSREQLEAIGIVFKEDADDLFIYVTLPEGWRKEATSHSMWSKLVDDKGRERASIFYKAAIYDRDAFVNLTRRYGYSADPLCGWNADYREIDKDSWQGVVKDRDEIIWRTETILDPRPDGDDEALRAWYRAKDALGKEAKQWLDENYPLWQEPTAYWD